MLKLLIAIEDMPRIPQKVMEYDYIDLWNWMMKDRKDLFERVNSLRSKYQDHRLDSEEPLSNFLKFESKGVDMSNLDLHHDWHKALSAHAPKLYVSVGGHRHVFDTPDEVRAFVAQLN